MQKTQFKITFKRCLVQPERLMEKPPCLLRASAGPDPAEYKWLRKVLSEGSALKRVETKNHDRLLKLHVALGIEWPRCGAATP